MVSVSNERMATDERPARESRTAGTGAAGAAGAVGAAGAPAGKPAATADVTAAVEVEHKFETPAGFTLPDLAGLPGVASVAAPLAESLDATYFDSQDLRLALARNTLRRRTGGHDAGWHLKQPRTDGARDELHVPLGRSTRTVPAQLRTLVEVHLRGAALVPVVRLTTARTVYRLLAASGEVLAEIAVDDVSAAAPSARGRSVTTTSWHEVEVELVGGDARLLKAVGKRLRAAGAVRSASPSKLSRALGDRLGDRLAARPAPVQLPQGSGAAVIHAYLTEQVAHLTVHDPLVRTDQEDAVHQMRVASRRLRSLLGTFRPLFDRAVTDPLRGELAWLGNELGGARDAEVTRDHLLGIAAAEAPELLVGPVLERIRTTLDARYRSAHDEALRELSSARYFALLDALDALVAAPPLTEGAQQGADAVLRPLVRRTWTRTRRLVAAADSASGPEHDLLLHDVRKSAKRARYAGESLIGAFGKDAKRYAGRMAAIQEALGDHQDSVVIREQLLELAAAAAAAGENAFSYGRLHALEQARADRTEGAFGVAWAQLQDSGDLDWLG